MKAKMIYLRHLVTKYPVSCFLIAMIWVLCLIPIPETPLDQVKLIDKWTHVTFYVTLGLAISIEYLRCHRKVNWRRLLVGAWLAPLLMGGLIEIVQATCTGGRRSGEWLDFAADSIGSTLAMLIGILLVVCFSRARRET
jgi:VanZ family protein